MSAGSGLVPYPGVWICGEGLTVEGSLVGDVVY
jgi:hypothetical protein